MLKQAKKTILNASFFLALTACSNSENKVPTANKNFEETLYPPIAIEAVQNFPDQLVISPIKSKELQAQLTLENILTTTEESKNTIHIFPDSEIRPLSNSKYIFLYATTPDSESWCLPCIELRTPNPKTGISFESATRSLLETSLSDTSMIKIEISKDAKKNPPFAKNIASLPTLFLYENTSEKLVPLSDIEYQEPYTAHKSLEKIVQRARENKILPSIIINEETIKNYVISFDPRLNEQGKITEDQIALLLAKTLPNIEYTQNDTNTEHQITGSLLDPSFFALVRAFDRAPDSTLRGRNVMDEITMQIIENAKKVYGQNLEYEQFILKINEQGERLQKNIAECNIDKKEYREYQKKLSQLTMPALPNYIKQAYESFVISKTLILQGNSQRIPYVEEFTSPTIQKQLSLWAEKNNKNLMPLSLPEDSLLSHPELVFAKQELLRANATLNSMGIFYVDPSLPIPFIESLIKEKEYALLCMPSIPRSEIINKINSFNPNAQVTNYRSLETFLSLATIFPPRKNNHILYMLVPPQETSLGYGAFPETTLQSAFEYTGGDITFLKKDKPEIFFPNTSEDASIEKLIKIKELKKYFIAN